MEPEVTTDRFEALFRTHYPRLVRLGTRILGDVAAAEEAAQDALLALADDPVMQRGEDDIAAWLNRVVTNVSLNSLRSRQRADLRERFVAVREPSDQVPDPADSIVQREDQNRVRHALATIPQRQAAALLLRHAGHSYVEVAAGLEVAIGSVGVLLARGERALRRALEDANPPGSPAATDMPANTGLPTDPTPRPEHLR